MVFLFCGCKIRIFFRIDTNFKESLSIVNACPPIVKISLYKFRDFPGRRGLFFEDGGEVGQEAGGVEASAVGVGGIGAQAGAEVGVGA